MICCFSGTGNSLHAARLLAQELHDRVADMAASDPSAVTSADPVSGAAAPSGGVQSGSMLGFVFPVYGWGLPRVVSRFISRLPRPGRQVPAHVYAVLTCGDDIGRTDRLLRRALRKRGYPLHAVYSVQMRNTYVCLPGFDTDPTATERDKMRRADDTLRRVARSIARRQPSTPADVVPGAWPGLKSYVLRPLFNRFLTTDRRFSADPALCTGCGRCAKLCPLHNISLNGETALPRWNGRCTHCLACYHGCPHHAIGYGKFTKGKGQVAIIV